MILRPFEGSDGGMGELCVLLGVGGELQSKHQEVGSFPYQSGLMRIYSITT